MPLKTLSLQKQCNDRVPSSEYVHLGDITNSRSLTGQEKMQKPTYYVESLEVYKDIDDRIRRMSADDMRTTCRVIGMVAKAHGIDRKLIGAVVLHDAEKGKVVIKLNGRGEFNIDDLVPMPALPLLGKFGQAAVNARKPVIEPYGVFLERQKAKHNGNVDGNVSGTLSLQKN